MILPLSHVISYIPIALSNIRGWVVERKTKKGGWEMNKKVNILHNHLISYLVPFTRLSEVVRGVGVSCIKGIEFEKYKPSNHTS